MTTALATSVPTGAMPSQLRSMVNAWYKNVDSSPMQMAKLHAEAAVSGVRATGESAVMGSILGGFHAMNTTGLDVKVPGTTHKVPADAIAALLGLVGGVGAATAPHGMGKTVANMGAAAAAVYGFRQTNDLIAKMKAAKAGATPAGGAAVAGNVTISKASFGGEFAPGSAPPRSQFGAEDPIVAFARTSL